MFTRGRRDHCFKGSDGIYAGGTTPSGFEADPSGQLPFPTPLVAGGPAESVPVAMLQPLPVKTPNPATPVKTADGKGEKEDPLTPVVVARTNVYQVPPKAVRTTQKLLPTAKVAARLLLKLNNLRIRIRPLVVGMVVKILLGIGRLVFTVQFRAKTRVMLQKDVGLLDAPM